MNGINDKAELTRIGQGNLIDFIRVKPDLILAASEHGGGEPLLQLERDHRAETGARRKRELPRDSREGREWAGVAVQRALPVRGGPATLRQHRHDRSANATPTATDVVIAAGGAYPKLEEVKSNCGGSI